MFDKTMMRGFLAAWAATMLAGAAMATQLVYDNGPPSPTDGGINATDPWCVSDSFTLTKRTTLQSIVLGLENDYPDYTGTPASVAWCIGSSACADDIDEGVSSLTTLSSTSYANNVVVFESSFSVDDILQPGTYWLSLNDMVASGYSIFVWDVDNGPSTAVIGYNGSVLGSVASESFQLYGKQVPEPAALRLLGSALLGVGAVYLRRRRAKG